MIEERKNKKRKKEKEKRYNAKKKPTSLKTTEKEDLEETTSMNE